MSRCLIVENAARQPTTKGNDMHANVVSIPLYKARHAKHGFDVLIYAQLRGKCPIHRIERAQRMCAANIRNGTQEAHAIQAAVRWAAVPLPSFDTQPAA